MERGQGNTLAQPACEIASSDKMVQTKAGAARSEWLKFVRECAVQYRARKNRDAPLTHDATDKVCTA
jgi:hypothetical protein